VGIVCHSINYIGASSSRLLGSAAASASWPLAARAQQPAITIAGLGLPFGLSLNPPPF